MAGCVTTLSKYITYLFECVAVAKLSYCKSYQRKKKKIKKKKKKKKASNKADEKGTREKKKNCTRKLIKISYEEN